MKLHTNFYLYKKLLSESATIEPDKQLQANKSIFVISVCEQ